MRITNPTVTSPLCYIHGAQGVSGYDSHFFNSMMTPRGCNFIDLNFVYSMLHGMIYIASNFFCTCFL